MNKIGKALRVMYWIVRKPVLLNRVLTDEDTWHSYVERKYRLPGGLPVVQMGQLIGSDPVTLGPITFLDGGSLPTDLMLLGGLAGGIDECTYFEIGTWRGESVATVAPRAKSCYTLCLTDEEMRKKGMHRNTIESHRQFSKGLANVIQLRGDSRSFDFEGLHRKFDLIYIDGDHHYDYLKSDTEMVFKYLVHENSIVVWHDYGFHPDTIRYEVMAAILDGVGSERADRIYHVAHTKTAIWTGKSIPSTPADFPVVPKEYYNTIISRHTLE
jgi:predicted O-methyltransferase YrrM